MPETIQLKPSADHRVRNFYPWVYRADIDTVQPEPPPGGMPSPSSTLRRTTEVGSGDSPASPDHASVSRLGEVAEVYPGEPKGQVSRAGAFATGGRVPPGEIVTINDARGQFVAQGFFNPISHIPLRVLSLEPAPIDEAFFRTRLRAAAARRAGRIANTNAWRVVNGESDQLPGLIVDRFGEVLVMQIRNAGMERRRAELVRLLAEELQPRGIYERSDVDARQAEGLEPRTGTAWGEVPAKVDVLEDDLRFEVSLAEGQKTGFYLDQRDNRRRLRALVGPGDRVLDVYSYVGAFGLHAARAGASVLCVDKDSGALALAERAARRNQLWPRVGLRWGDALEVMAALAAEQRAFTHIVLDPPTLVKRKEDLQRTRRLFVEMCSRALSLLDSSGTLFLSSCAFYVGTEDLLDAARIAAGAARRRVEVLDVTYQPADHPWILQVPETLYLKTVILRVE